MYEQNFENSNAKGRRRSSSNRKFGTDITAQNLSRAQTFRRPSKLVTEEVFDINTEIYKILHNTESNYLPREDFMKGQDDINANMRAILIDWIVMIQLKMRFCAETLYLTVNIIDRCIDKIRISRKELQLLGVCAMLVACKYEETTVPEVKDLVFITADAYTKDQVIDMESLIVKHLDFNFTIVSLLRFIERYNRLMVFSEKESLLAKYFAELTLVEYGFNKYKPSAIAAAVVVLVEKLRKGSAELALPCEIPYYCSELKDCVVDLVYVIEKSETCPLQAIRNKYALDAFMEVSKFSFAGLINSTGLNV